MTGSMSPSAQPSTDQRTANPRAVVHVGTHKTGTTAFQKWARDESAELAASAGIHLYEGLFGTSHYELPILCLRPNRNMPMRTKTPDWCLDSWQADVRAHIRAQVERPVTTLLCSAEALSFLRYSDEIERLAELLDPREISAVVVLREPAAFLRSYTSELERTGFQRSSYPESFAYVEKDSWLIRYDELVDAYSAVLGRDRVCVLAYEEHVDRDGSILPALLQACGVDPAALPSWQGVWKHRSRVVSRTTAPPEL